MTVQVGRDGVLVGVDDRREPEPELQEHLDQVLHVAQVDVDRRHHDRQRRGQEVAARRTRSAGSREAPGRRVAEGRDEDDEHRQLDEEVDHGGADVGERQDLARKRDLLHERRAVDDDPVAVVIELRNMFHTMSPEKRYDHEVRDAVLQEDGEDQEVDREREGGMSIDHKSPSAEFLYLMRMSDEMRPTSSSRRDHRMASRRPSATRALTTRTGVVLERARLVPRARRGGVAH